MAFPKMLPQLQIRHDVCPAPHPAAEAAITSYITTKPTSTRPRQTDTPSESKCRQDGSTSRNQSATASSTTSITSR